MIPTNAETIAIAPDRPQKSLGKEVDENGFVNLQNKEGVTIKAKVLQISEDTVRLMREDYVVFRAPIDLFSDEDQAYFTRWELQDLGANNQLVSISASKVIGDTKSYTDIDTKGKSRSFHYVLRLRNLTNRDLPGVHVQYHYHISTTGHVDTPLSSHDRSPMRFGRGASNTTHIRPNQDVEFQTRSESLYNSRTEMEIDGIKYKGGSGRQELIGITVFLYYQGIQIASFADPSSLLNKN